MKQLHISREGLAYKKMSGNSARRKPLIPSSKIITNMAFILLLAVSSVIGFAGIYYIYRQWFGGDRNRHTDGDQDDIDGYRNEQVRYLTDVAEFEGKGVNRELIEKLKRKIEKYGEEADVEYIGITSGSDPVTAMKSRVDAKKRRLGINCMRLLYETDSHDNCTEVESILINYSKDIHEDENENEVGGGGGRKPAEAGRYYVYAAYRYS